METTKLIEWIEVERRDRLNRISLSQTQQQVESEYKTVNAEYDSAIAAIRELEEDRERLDWCEVSMPDIVESEDNNYGSEITINLSTTL